VEAENQKLRLQLKVGKDAAVQDDLEKIRICEELEGMVQQKSSDEGEHKALEKGKARMLLARCSPLRTTNPPSSIVRSHDMITGIMEKIMHYKERHADYGSDRRAAVQYHLSQLESLLVPTQTTKMSLWTVQQEDSFFSEEEQGSLSTILFRELEVTDEQKKRITQKREMVRGLSRDLRHSLRLVKELRQKVDSKHEMLDSQMAELQKVLTPIQAAKFIVWVKNNEACMTMLNKLWDKMDDR
jgi:hypothetical protein